MGGFAFPTLVVPRLTPDQYIHLRDKCMIILKDFFHDVEYPTPAPQKIDYGDVDIYVCRPRGELNLQAIQEALSATDRVKHGPTNSFAVAMPEQRGQHAQVDVHICVEGYLEWSLFMSGYGDLAQIIGVLNRKLGITMNDKGINVRVAELETMDRQKSMILLTKEPRQAMEFLGLDADQWTRGFDTEAEIFAWCSSGRYFNAPSMKLENAEDRARVGKRPMFTRYFEQWLPEHINTFQAKPSSRQQVLDDAIARFDVQSQYDSLITCWKKEMRQRRISEALREHIPAGKVGLRMIMRGIKRWVTWQNSTFLLEPEDQPRDAKHAPVDPEWFATITDDDMPRFLDWLQVNHGTIRDMEARLGHRRGRQNGMQ